MVEREVDHAVGCASRVAQALEVVERAAMHLCAGRGERSGRGIGARQLQERELIKLGSLAGALAEALRAGRGVEDRIASLAAETGIAVFKVAFESWVEEADQQDLPRVIRRSLGELEAVTAGR